MARVPAKMYRKITQRPYTRREFMGGVPGLRILQFQSGNKSADFPVELDLIVEERGQIRHSALEAMRITAVRYMDKKAGRENYHLIVRTYPHHVLRQNKQASGAGADRVSMGMRLSFGKPIGTAARVGAGRKIVTIRTVARAIPFAKAALRKAQNKVSMPCHLDVRSADPDRSLQEMINLAFSRGTRALSGAGAEDDTVIEEQLEDSVTEAGEEEGLDIEDEEGEEDEEGTEATPESDSEDKDQDESQD